MPRLQIISRRWHPLPATTSQCGVFSRSLNSIAQPHAIQRLGAQRAVGDVEQGGKTFGPVTVAAGAVLTGIAFDRGHAGHPRGETGGVQERAAGAGQVLNAEEHAVLLRLSLIHI